MKGVVDNKNVLAFPNFWHQSRDDPVDIMSLGVRFFLGVKAQ
jgi:hypothetical protein